MGALAMWCADTAPMKRMSSPSIPIPLTSLTILKILSNPLSLPSNPLQAAPIQNRVDPFSLACRAAWMTGSSLTRGVAFVGVPLWWVDWEQ